ncbi:trigger factor [Striga asiatica]|uniref:Trigger factor n=1 Tax=Striga asiatica TaxID=4170 RepID=A0A5A7R7H7_STRAF|nr:trigger factor [Striga asiatica]
MTAASTSETDPGTRIHYHLLQNLIVKVYTNASFSPSEFPCLSSGTREMHIAALISDLKQNDPNQTCVDRLQVQSKALILKKIKINHFYCDVKILSSSSISGNGSCIGPKQACALNKFASCYRKLLHDIVDDQVFHAIDIRKVNSNWGILGQAWWSMNMFGILVPSLTDVSKTNLTENSVIVWDVSLQVLLSNQKHSRAPASDATRSFHTSLLDPLENKLLYSTRDPHST